MKFGMPALVECADVYDCLRTAKALELDFIELNSSFPAYLPARLDANNLKIIKEKTGIFYTMHADEQMNLFDFNPRISECYFGAMSELMELAVSLEMPIINLHLQKGVYVTLPDKVILLTDVYKDEYLQAVKRFISMAECKLRGTGVKIAIENVDSNPFTSSQQDALELMMASPVLALTLDVGHEMKLGYKDSHIFEKYPDKIVHMHLHDCDGIYPHLPLGEGRISVTQKLAQIGENATCLIEVKTIDGLEKSIKYLKEKSIW